MSTSSKTAMYRFVRKAALYSLLVGLSVCLTFDARPGAGTAHARQADAREADGSEPGDGVEFGSGLDIVGAVGSLDSHFKCNT